MSEATAKKATKKASKTAPKRAVKSATKKTTTAKGADDFAVIETGGKQYIVAVGDVVEVERMSDCKVGDTIEFENVLMTDNGKDVTIGTPYIDGAKVKGTYQGEKKGKKLSIIRFQSKSNRHRKVGHRQKYSIVQIDAIA